MLALKEFRSNALAFPDLLNYCSFIDDGIMLNKDGSLSAGFYYRASDLSSMTYEERNALIAKINQVFLKLGNGWAVHIDCTRVEAEKYLDGECYYTNKIAKLIEDERKRYFKDVEHFENFFTMIFTYLPPNKSVGKFVDLMVVDESKPVKQKQDLEAKILEYFKHNLQDIQRSMSNYIVVEMLTQHHIEDEFNKTIIQDDLLSYINFCICGERQSVCLPKIPMFLDCIIGAKEFLTGMRPKIDEKFIGVVAIEGFPSESFPNILNQLTELNFAYRFNTRYIFLDKMDALKQISTYRKKWQQKVRGWLDQLLDRPSTKVNKHAINMVDEADEASTELNQDSVAYGYYSANIIIFDEDPASLDNKTKTVKSCLEKLGFIARVEGINAVEAYLGSLPGFVYPNIRRPLLNTLNLAHLIPLAAIWTGDKYNLSDKFPPRSPALMQVVTHGATPFKLNLHVHDIGHTLVFGPTGAGKSVLLANLLFAFQKYKNAQVFAFDKGRSLLAPTLASKGIHYDIGNSEKELALAPLSNINSPEQLIWAENWVETCLNLQGVMVTPRHKKLIHEALINHAKTKSRSVTDFVSSLQDTALRDALNHYTIAGSAGILLDGEHDDLAFKRVTTFEIEELMNLGEKNILPTLLYIFRKIELALNGDPSILIIDEAWIALAHKSFKEKIVEWLKVFRKLNCAVVLATQSLSDSARSGILDVLQESCPTKIFLPNNEAFNKGSENTLAPYDFYKIFGLNDIQISIIANSEYKRQYYYSSPFGTRLFDLGLGEINLAFCAKSDKQSLQRINSLANKDPHSWPMRWLDELGINYREYEYEKSYI